MKLLMILLSALLFIASSHVNAQSEPQVVELLVDDISLVADYYASTPSAPTIVLLHMLDSRRNAWESLIPHLLDAGYNVLAPDLRGHGDSQGTRDWQAAVSDIDAWLDWLASQGAGERPVAMVGASLGGTLAILGCSNNAECLSVIAISPPFESRGLSVADAVPTGLAEKSLLVIAMHDDERFAEDAQRMLALANGEASVHLYAGTLHGTDMFALRRMGARLRANILTWLGTHLPDSP